MPSAAAQIERLTKPDTFFWATGIEDTFITHPWPATGRTLDEYQLTDHYARWREDIGLMADIGVSAARYGVPWHRIQPAPNEWNWETADRPLERLLELGIAPIVDLVHYGLPRWIDNAYLHPNYPALVAEYAARLADRFKGRITLYTPLNEPRITAWYCGRLGWWPPFRHGWRGFVALMLAICRGIVRTVRALADVDPDIVPVHVDATDLYVSSDPGLDEEVRHRQELVFLALDLISGRVDSDHPLWTWLLEMGATPAELEEFLSEPLPLPLIGINLYPMFTQKRLIRTAEGRLRIHMPYASGDLVTSLGRKYHARYRAPLFISETASKGSVARRQRWLDDSVAAVRTLRQEGIPLVGYTWWPLFALVAWAYRQGSHPISRHLLQMGLWNLESLPDSTLERRPTSLVQSYRTYAASGVQAVGRLAAAADKTSSMQTAEA